jgi:hypothetical protein
VNLPPSMSARWLPPLLRKRQIGKLLRLTAEAFDAEAPSLRGLSLDDSLKTFATFTRDEAGKALRTGRNLDPIASTLYHRAFELGRQCRKWLRIGDTEGVMSAARVLYGICNIDFQGTREGEVTVSRCFFSEYYSGAVCRVISSLDAGLLAGMSGGRQLTFSQRITEGAGACTGLLSEGETR